MGLEQIIGGIFAFVLVVLGAFGYGTVKAKARAKAEMEKQLAKDSAAATKVAANRRVAVTKEANNAQQTVNHLPADDVDRELLKDWSRKD